MTTKDSKDKVIRLVNSEVVTVVRRCAIAGTPVSVGDKVEVTVSDADDLRKRGFVE